MENFFNRIKRLLPSKSEMRIALSSFSTKERRVLVLLFCVLFVTTLTIVQNINKSFMVTVPLRGGSLNEGIVGTPRFVNPVLALSDADKDLTSLVYSGLTRKYQSGQVIPDLAESYTVSKDGLSYTFVLKDKIYFHDGTPVTADDVIFTINEIKDPLTKSPRKSNWDGITVQKINEKTIEFNLKQPYESFLENATVGILPASIWKGTPIELNDANTNPIGSGPYKVTGVSKQSSGIIDNYTLKQFNKFVLGAPYIKNLTLKFYPNENDLISALKNGNVDQVSGLTPENAEKLKNIGYNIQSSVLPRVFGLFFNQNQAQIFTDKKIIEAMNQAIDKDRIVNEVLKNYGVTINDPIPPNMLAYQKLNNDTNTSREENVKKAIAILTKDGWVKGEDGYLHKTTTTKKNKKTTKSTSDLTFVISTGNAPELSKTADIIKENLTEIGMKVEIQTFEIGNLNQSVIRPRKYDALLFGQIINHESDLFAFWHSSQRLDPGLNVAMYTNAKVDKILEDALVTVDEKNRVKKYASFEDEINRDMPAVFLYSPSFIYVVSKNLDGLNIDHITTPEDRFLNIYEWSVEKDGIWKIFSK